MNNYLYFRNLIVVFVFFIVAIWVSIKFFRGGVLLKPERAVASVKPFVERHGRLLTAILYLGYLLFTLFTIVSNTGLFLDLPNVFQGQYLETSGYAVGQSLTGKTDLQVRSIRLRDEKKNQVIRVTFLGRYDIHKGDYLSLYYYPHSEIGAYTDRSVNDRK